MSDVVGQDAEDVTPREAWVLYSRDKALLLEREKGMTHEELELHVRAFIDKHDV